MKIIDKIDEYFQSACGSNGCVDLKAAFKLLWATLNNSVSAVDLAGVFSIAIPSNNPVEALSRELFHDFLKAYARLKFPSGGDFIEKLLEDLRQIKSKTFTSGNAATTTTSAGKSHTIPSSSTSLHQQQLQVPFLSSESNLIFAIADKTIIRILLKYDLPLRRAFAAFSGQSVRVGGLVTWEEVKTLSLGMELDGLLSFAGTYALLPNHLSSQQIEIIFREIISKYALLGNATALHSSILYPQFQLMMVLLAVERVEVQQKKNEKVEKLFAKKPHDGRSKLIADCLVELFKDMGIHRFDDQVSYPLQYRQNNHNNTTTSTTTGTINAELDHTTSFQGGITFRPGESILPRGQITLPLNEKKEDLYTSGASNLKQVQTLRLDHLFEDLQRNLMEKIQESIVTTNANTASTTGAYNNNNNTTTTTMGTIGFPETSTTKVFDVHSLLAILSHPMNDAIDTKSKLPTKPVVICDALPIPADCPQTIDQLLEAALAHHNLGSFEDSLKFLEACKIQLLDIIETNKKKKTLTGGTVEVNITFTDIRLYLAICKGNVYQSAGDDEQSLIQYLEGYHLSQELKDQDWEIICLNSIGVLGFFNLRYDVALLCFYLVYEYRDRMYGAESADTATALNNLGCCLYCLNRRGEARLKFERAWNVLSSSIGHRASRTVLVWKNLEKARRSHAAAQTKKDLKESIEMRPDAEKLILGGGFTIQATVPVETKSKKKGKKKKSK